MFGKRSSLSQSLSLSLLLFSLSLSLLLIIIITMFFFHTSYDLLFLFLDSSLERLGCSFNNNLVLDEWRTASGAFVKQGTISLQSMQYLTA